MVSRYGVENNTNEKRNQNNIKYITLAALIYSLQAPPFTKSHSRIYPPSPTILGLSPVPLRLPPLPTKINKPLHNKRHSPATSEPKNRKRTAWIGKNNHFISSLLRSRPLTIRRTITTPTDITIKRRSSSIHRLRRCSYCTKERQVCKVPENGQKKWISIPNSILREEGSKIESKSK